MPKTILKILLAVALLLAAATAILWFWFTSSGRPLRQGEVELAGLSGNVEVRWDRWGVPSIQAASGVDAAMALGWLHANDRMTQLELGRRAASGRLSEVVGEATLQLDEEARRLRLRAAARGAWEAAGPESRAWLEAYARGVNTWLEERDGDLPPALRLLRLRPEPWEPVDSLCFALLMARDLSFWDDRPEEERFLWLRAFGEGRTRQLLGAPDAHLSAEVLSLAGQATPGAASADDDSSNGGLGGTPQNGALLAVRGESPPPARARDFLLNRGGSSAGDSGIIENFERRVCRKGPLLARSEFCRGLLDSAPGSNNWALGASWTGTGAPLVANDPHLPLRLPGVWYQVLVRSPDYEVAGMTIPGLPGVVIGRSAHMAWALTNVMLDDHDLFLEELDETGQRVRRGETWVDLVVEREEILVSGGETRTIVLRSTDRGPMLEADPDRGLPARSLAWTGHRLGDSLGAFLNLARAERLEDVPAAVASYVAPAQNLVVAHRDGGLLYTVLGRIPQRRAGGGRLPSPGWDPAYGWDGLRPAETNPRILAPEDDLLITANHDIRPPDYELPLSANFDLPHRADRIRQRLEARRDWQARDLARVQGDTTSLYARQVIDAVEARLASSAPPADSDAGKALALLRGWDGEMSERGPAALYSLWEWHLGEAILGDEARQQQLPPFANRQRTLAAISGELDGFWFDDVQTPRLESPGETLTEALAEAWKETTARWGTDPAAWPYGELHSLSLRHPVSALPGLGRFFDRGPFPMSGSASTVAAFGGRWQARAEGAVKPVVYGPSMRWLVDLADVDGGFAVLPGGQSGHPWDPHYDDQIPLYLSDEVRPVAWSDEAIRRTAVSTLRFLPGSVRISEPETSKTETSKIETSKIETSKKGSP